MPGGLCEGRLISFAGAHFPLFIARLLWRNVGKEKGKKEKRKEVGEKEGKKKEIGNKRKRKKEEEKENKQKCTFLYIAVGTKTNE